MRIADCAILILTLVPIFGQCQKATYSKKEVLEDLAYLQEQLDERHPNIDIYTSNKTFTDFFKKIEIPDKLSETEAYSIISSTNQVIQDGHTLFLPGQEYINRNNESGLYLPLQPFWDGTKLYVLKNYRTSNKISPGTEISSINGVKSSELIQGMLSKMMRDGGNYNYPIWVLNNFFFEYYSYFYGCSESYELGTKINEQEKVITIRGIVKPELFRKMGEDNKADAKGISIEMDSKNKTAILTIKDWHNHILKERYNQKFIPVIKNIIQQIENKNIENLIIDVRNNQGGDPKNAKYLLSYLLHKPFVLVENYNKKIKGKLTKTRGPQMGIHKPMTKTYDGNIYVITNGGSFSNTGIFCSVLKQHQRASFIGQETGSSEFVICGSIKNLTLPNTRISIQLATLQFLIKAYSKDDLHGIKPDFIVKPTIESLIKGEDVEIEYIKTLIN